VTNKLIALQPKRFDSYVSAIEAAGGELSDLGPDVEALIWTDYSKPDLLLNTLEANPQLRWVQLPFAGVDAFADLLHLPVTFTSAKRSYSEPVAEHALMLAMALGRILPQRVKAQSWGQKHADSLYDEDVVIVGGGGIAQELVRLLVPFRSRVKVVRKRASEPFEDHGIAEVLPFEKLDEALSKAKFVFLACALTDETRFLFSTARFSALRSDSYLVNVARGEVVDQEALLTALDLGVIAGAATDVTYPEPLPEGHPMWGRDDLIITPHTADTKPIVERLFSQRLSVNVAAWISGNPLTGVVDPELGY
jgi:phosphoglycerate dehydrogenase-like enzyme